MISINPINFINTIKDSDYYIEQIYTQGGCYQFHKILKTIFPDAIPYVCGGINTVINKEWIDHVVTEIEGLFYDIQGVFNPEASKYEFVRPLKTSELPLVETWRFTNMHYIPNCEECEFPVLASEFRKMNVCTVKDEMECKNNGFDDSACK